MDTYITFVGDIHGCFETFKALLGKIPTHNNRIVLLGDIINKGKRSYETFSFVKKNNFEMLLGNHEYYCMNRNKAWAKELWLRMGGMETIKSIKNSLNIESRDQIQEILAEMSFFFEASKRYLLVENSNGIKILATHGGINSKIFRQNNYKIDLSLSIDLRIPGSFIFNKTDLAKIPNCIQVIGHQPTEYWKIKSDFNYKLDTGCVYDKKGMGWLSAIMFNLKEDLPPTFYHQKNID
ncbi:MAG: metallophosphoesterase [Flammeovirgaceae bacterium]|nr:metallophosphoesterase [Flammeovirgaceae bacterium]